MKPPKFADTSTGAGVALAGAIFWRTGASRHALARPVGLVRAQTPTLTPSEET
jgi:hypothetical protein